MEIFFNEAYIGYIWVVVLIMWVLDSDGKVVLTVKKP